MDFRARVNKICAPLPGAVKEDPWGGGHDAWKVGDKMFATIGVKADGVSVKCADIESPHGGGQATRSCCPSR